jgi:DNA-binding GntR family transcriptional regulator
MAKKINPIHSLEEVEHLRRRLSSKPRDLLLFNLITLAGLRLSDVLSFKVKDLYGLSVGDFIPVSGISTDLERKPVMTRQIKESYDLLLKKTKPRLEDYLIKSKKSNTALEPPSVSRLVAQWFEKEKMEGLAGVKSLRKTWEHHFGPKIQSNDLETRSNVGSIYGNLVAIKISDQVYSNLLDLILTGKLIPGERLIARHIAEKMNVSPMPIRDALNRLAANGIVNIEANRSYYVNSLSKKDLIEITDVRMILEPVAATQAAKIISDREIDDIIETGEIFQKAVERGARNTLVKNNREFHFKLYNSTNNQKLINFIDQLWNMLSPYLYLLSEKSKFYDFKKGGYKNHQEIVIALRKRDCESIEYWIQKDIQFAFDGIMAEFFN